MARIVKPTEAERKLVVGCLGCASHDDKGKKGNRVGVGTQGQNVLKLFNSGSRLHKPVNISKFTEMNTLNG